MKLDHDARKAMGLAARAHMEAEFDKKQIVAKTIEALGLTNK